MKNKIILVIALISFSTVSFSQKIGYLNIQELLREMPEIKKADSLLEQFAAQMQEIYNGYILDYTQKLDDYDKNSSTWTEVKIEFAREDLAYMQQRMTDYENNSNKKLALKKEELYGPILENVKANIKLVGEENKLTAILDGSALLYFGPDAIDVLPMVKKKMGLI